jgi:molybdenum cofactor synthesis domain-containing protein
MNENKYIKTASIIVIGDEILSGQVQDKNINFIAKNFFLKGIVLKEVRIIPDQKKDIIDALNSLYNKYTYVITTGGIGPTHDDITIDTVAELLSVPLDINIHAAKSFNKDISTELSYSEKKMSSLPRGAKLIFCTETRAPGFYIENIFCLAGYTKICVSMFRSLTSLIKQERKIHKESIISNISESHISLKLKEVQAQYKLVSIGSYPSYSSNYPELLITISGKNLCVIREVTQEIRRIILQIEMTNACDHISTL